MAPLWEVSVVEIHTACHWLCQRPEKIEKVRKLWFSGQIRTPPLANIPFHMSPPVWGTDEASGPSPIDPWPAAVPKVTATTQAPGCIVDKLVLHTRIR